MNSQQHCSPAGAREAFKLRPYKNFAVGLALFALLCLLLLLFLNVWVAALVALVPAFCLFYYLEARVIILTCPSCKQAIDANTPWLCGYKGCRNENLDHEHPFINECEHCHFIPRVYECHHCRQPIYLASDRLLTHMARCLVDPRPPQPPKNPREEKGESQREEIGDWEHQLKLTTLKKQVEIEQNKPVTPSSVAMTPEQAFEEEILRNVKQGMALDTVARKLKAQADVDYADDLQRRLKMHALIDQQTARYLE